MPIWLFALGVLGGLLLLSLADPLGYGLAIAWGFVVFPQGAAYIWRQRRGLDVGSRDENGSGDIDTHYWRTNCWWTTNQ
jgi:hypothetical protein